MKGKLSFWFVFSIMFSFFLIGFYSCGEDPSQVGDDDDITTGDDDDDDSTCETPCKSDLDCAFGESCECPEDTPNCRVSEMCCTGAGDDDDDNSCVSSFDCDPGYECIESICTLTGDDDDVVCYSNEDCGPNEKCINDRCADVGGDCAAGTIPMIATSHQQLEFVNAAVGLDETLNLIVSNEGTCDLKISSVEFENASSEEFSCERCSPNKDLYPMIIPPAGSTNIGVTVTPVKGEPQSGALLITSNDPDYPLVRVALSLELKGQAILKVTPPELSFGHVNVGEDSTKSLVISNGGKGNAVLKIKSVYNPHTVSDVTVITSDPTPYNLSPGQDMIADVTFAPTDMLTYSEEIIVEVEGADNPDDELENGTILRIPVTGASVQEGNIRVSPTTIDFGEIPADQEVTELIEICNDGGKNITPGYYWDPLSDPYFDNLNPNKIGMVPGGGCFFLNITYRPDPDDANTWKDHKAILHITSDDEQTPDIEIDMTGSAINPIVNEALKIEMAYDNNANNWATGDLRAVTLIYISEKYGFCDQVDPKPDWMEEGRPRWSKIGQDSNPQFVFHASGFEDDLINVGLFDVMVSYDEDCASIPIDILAQVLNIGPDLLLSYLTSGLLPPGMIDLDLGNMCLSRKSSNVNVTAYINGVVASAKGVKLSKKGDDDMVFVFHRKDGKFEIY